MATFFSIVIPLLAIFAIGATLYFGIRAFRHKASLSSQAYNVGQQHKRREMQIDMLRAGTSLVVALIMLGVIGFSAQPSDSGEEEMVEGEETMTPTAEQMIEEPTSLPDTAVPTQPPVVNTEVPPTEPAEPALPTSQPTVTAVPTVAPEPQPQTAFVNSEVGVWLRSAPSTSGEQVEWLLNGAELVVLDGKQSADDLEWQQVRASSGNEGWVAVPFITYNE